MSRHLSAPNCGSSTCSIELQPQTDTFNSPSALPTTNEAARQESIIVGNELLQQATSGNAVEQLQRWNNPRSNIPRTFTTFLSFAIMGATDAAYGALIPYFESYYNLTYTITALIFLSPLFGFLLAAFFNNRLHRKYGQRGIALTCSTFRLAAYLIIAFHPPFPVIICAYALLGFGHGLSNAAWNAWVGAFANANEVLGFLHGFYGLGATASPLIVSSMVAKAGMPWYTFYYLLVGHLYGICLIIHCVLLEYLTSSKFEQIGIATIELISATTSFWKATGEVFIQIHSSSPSGSENGLREALTKSPASRLTWLCMSLLFLYVGVEVALGGWLVTFMINIRKGSAFASSMTATGFWMGLTIGRVVLGFVTPRIGERYAIPVYLGIAITFELLFWLIPQFYVSAVSVSFQGFFIGPIYPAAMAMATKFLPKYLHVSAIRIINTAGGCGGAVFPFAVGAIAQAKGVKTLQPIILSMTIVLSVIWLGLPKSSRRND